MCTDCGCQEANKEFFPETKTKTIHLSHDILEKNNHIAHHNHHWFEDHQVKAINMMSSPGAGKTFLLEKTNPLLKKASAILVGDQQTNNDAKRLKLAGARAQQINTLNSCHLDASMIENHLGDFVSGSEELLFIENVGNLVCPAGFDLGEARRVALLSVTEGEDKPEKYPSLFHRAHLILVTKIDLEPYLDFDREKATASIRAVNPHAHIQFISAKTGEGMDQWIHWVEEH